MQTRLSSHSECVLSLVDWSEQDKVFKVAWCLIKFTIWLAPFKPWIFYHHSNLESFMSADESYWMSTTSVSILYFAKWFFSNFILHPLARYRLKTFTYWVLFLCSAYAQYSRMVLHVHLYQLAVSRWHMIFLVEGDPHMATKLQMFWLLLKYFLFLLLQLHYLAANSIFERQSSLWVSVLVHRFIINYMWTIFHKVLKYNNYW